MDKQKLKQALVEKKMFVKATANGKNYICICPYCGDHLEKYKRGHLYISTDKNVCHCFFCNGSWQTTAMLKKNGIDSNKIYTKIEQEYKPNSGVEAASSAMKRKLKVYKLPKIDMSFENKRAYIKKRTNYLAKPEDIPNLVFNIQEFIHINNIQYKPNTRDVSIEYLNTNFVGFLTKNHTKLICRNVDPDSSLKFKKIDLQDDPYEMIDYYVIYGNHQKGNKIVMAEGIFNALAEYYTDSLGIKDETKLYVACNSFSYSSVLKSVCFDYHIFESDVVILSDADKKLLDYNKYLYQQSSHILNSLNIYYNELKNDFGMFPLKPIKGGNLNNVISAGKKVYKTN